MSYWPQKYGDPETVENIDYEKTTPPAYAKYFEDTSNPVNVSKQSSPEEQPSYAKYFKEEPGTLEKIANKIKIPIQAATKGLIALPHTLGEISQFVNEKTGLPLGGVAGSLKDFFPSYQSLIEKAKELGIHIEPEGFLEKGLEKVGRFGGEAPAFGGLGGLRGAAGIIGAGFGSQAAEELNANLPGSVALTIAGDIAARRLSGGTVNAYRAFTDPKKAFAESFMFKRKPNEKMKQAIEAFERQGIQPPLTSVTKAPVAKFIEKEASLNPLTEEVFEKFTNDLSDNMVGLWEKALDEGSKLKIPTAEEAASRLQSEATLARDIKRKGVSDAYERIRQTLPPDARISSEGSGRIKQKAEGLKESINTLIESAEDVQLKEKAGELAKNIDNFQYQQSRPYDEAIEVIDSFSGKRLDSPAIEVAFERAKELHPQVADQFDEIKNELIKKKSRKGAKPTKEELINDIESIRDKEASLPIDVLEGTNKSINSMLDYEVQGGLKNRLREIQKSVEHELDEFAKTNPKYKEYRDFAKKEHGQLAQIFRNDLAESILYGKRPEQILKAMSTPGGVHTVEKMIGKNSELMNALKRNKLEQWLTDKMLLGEEFRLGGTKSIEARRNQEMFNALTSPEQRNYFKDLASIDKSIRKGMSKYLNTSGTENLKRQMGDWMGLLIEPFISILQGEPLSALTAPLSPFFKSKIAHLATDPEFIKLVQNAHRSVNTGSQSKYIRAAQELVDYLDKTFQEE